MKEILVGIIGQRAREQMLDQEFWKKYFKIYDILNLVIPYQELLDTIIEELQIKKGDLVLEAGCGTGNLCIRLKEAGAEVIGIDNMKEALDIYRGKDPEAKAVLHDLTQPLPFPDSYFNKIACNNTLYAIPVEQRPKVIQQFYRILKPGGVVVVSNPLSGFKPLLIYLDHFRKESHQLGTLRSALRGCALAAPTIRMFYFNSLIKKAHKEGSFELMDPGVQKTMLEQAGFNTRDEKAAYAGQAILCRADK